MISNLKLINPSKENELFSVHNYRKLNLSQYSSNSYFNTNYKSFISQKNSLLSLKKGNKFGLLTETNKKNKTNYSIRNSKMSQIPYPSFPKKNKIPAIFRNSYNKVKYPKIAKSNFILYNYNKSQNQNQNNKNIFYNTYSSIGVNTDDNNLCKEQKKNINNKTYYINLEETKSNGVFTLQNDLSNQNSIKNRIFNIEFKKKNNIKNGSKQGRDAKITNFSNVLDNMMHLIEVKDQNNNSLLYTKVTNLLLNELNKLFDLKKNRYKKEIEDRILTYRKINMSNRKMRLSGDSNLSFVESTQRRVKSSKLHKLIKINIYRKYGFHLHNFKKMKFRRRSQIAPPLIPDYRNRNALYQDYDSLFKNKFFNDNYFKGKLRYDQLNKNKYELKSKLNHDNNTDINNGRKNVDQNNNNSNSLFTNFYKDSRKSHGRKFNISSEHNHGKTVNPNLLHNFINSSVNEDKEVPIFEQMVKNDKLIRLIHEYLEEEEKENKKKTIKKEEEKKITEKNKINEKEKEKLKIEEKKDEKDKNNLEGGYYDNNGKMEFVKNEIDENEENKVMDDSIYKNEENDTNKNENIKQMGDIEDLLTENGIKNIELNNETKNEKEKIVEILIDGHKKNNNEENTIMSEEIFNNEENNNNSNNSNFFKENSSDIFDENENKNENEKIGKNIDVHKKRKKRVKFTIDDKENGNDNSEEFIEENKNQKKINKLKKLELEVEIVRHVSGEIKIKKDEQENIEHILDDLVEISHKENLTKREDNYKNRVLMPMDDITREYLNNMRKINASHKKPKYLFDKSLKLLLKKKMKELIEIGGEEYYYDEEQEQEKEKENKENMNQKNNMIHIVEEKKESKKENEILKQLIYDHSYFFNKKKKNKNIGNKVNNNIKLNSSFQKDDDNEEEDPLIRRGSFLHTPSFDFNFFKNKSKSKYSRKSSQFYFKTKKSHGLKLLIDETDKNYMKKKMLKTIGDEAKIKNDEIMDRKLKAFFEHIKMLKNISESNDEEKLRLYLDREIERFDYTQEKRAEERRFNFFNDLKMARMASRNEKKFFSKKLLFHPPLIFNIHKNNI